MTFRVGTLFPLSGDWAWVGEPCQHAVRMALQYAKERGVPGVGDIEILEGDSVSPDHAAPEAERLADAGATVLFGTMFSSHAFPASEVAHRRGAVYWEAVAAADGLSRRGHDKFFRLDTTAAVYGGTVAAFVRDQLLPAWGVRPSDLRLSIASMEESFSTSMGDALVEAARAAGFQTARETFPYGNADIPALVDRVARFSPHVVFMTAFGPAVGEFGRLARARLPLKALIGNGAWALNHRVAEIGAALDGVFSVDTPHVTGLGVEGLTPAAQARLAWWREHCGEVHSIKTAVDRDLVFIAANVLFEEVLPRSASASAADIAAAARTVDVALWETILGYGVRFDERGDNTRTFAAMLQWQNGERRTVAPDRIAVAKPRLAPLELAPA